MCVGVFLKNYLLLPHPHLPIISSVMFMCVFHCIVIINSQQATSPLIRFIFHTSPFATLRVQVCVCVCVSVCVKCFRITYTHTLSLNVSWQKTFKGLVLRRTRRELDLCVCVSEGMLARSSLCAFVYACVCVSVLLLLHFPVSCSPRRVQPSLGPAWHAGKALLQSVCVCVCVSLWGGKKSHCYQG